MESVEDAVNLPVTSLVREQERDERVIGSLLMGFRLSSIEAIMSTQDIHQENQTTDLQSPGSHYSQNNCWTTLSHWSATPCPYGYVKAWEGNLTDLEEGKSVVFDRMVVYRRGSTSQALFSSWPDVVSVEELVPRSQLDEMQTVGEKEYLLVDTLFSKSELLPKAKHGGAYIKLPHQTLLLYPSDKWCHFIGVLCNGGSHYSRNKSWTALSKSHLGIGTSSEPINVETWKPLVNFGGSSSTSNLKSRTYERHFQVVNEMKRRPLAICESSTFNPIGRGNFAVNSEKGENSYAMMNRHGDKTPLSHWRAVPFPPGHVKAWEGNLTYLEEGKIVVFDRMVVYRRTSTSQALFGSWPNRVLVEEPVHRSQLDEMQTLGEKAYLLVDTLFSKSELFPKAKYGGTYIKLPHQTLLLYPSDEWSHFVGVLCNGVFGYSK